MVPTDKVHLSRLHQLPHLWALQMLRLVAIRRREICHQTAIVTVDDGAASTCGLRFVVAVDDFEPDVACG